jgi:chromosome segregation ATPase
MSMGMSEYEREGMIRLLTAGAVERGELEAEIEFHKMKVRQLEAEVEFQKAKVHELETEIEVGGEEWNMAEWRKTYKALVMLLHPDKNGSPGEDDNKTKAFKVVSSLNEFYYGKTGNVL